MTERLKKAIAQLRGVAVQMEDRYGLSTRRVERIIVCPLWAYEELLAAAEAEPPEREETARVD